MLAGATPDEAFAYLILKLESLKYKVSLDDDSYFLSFEEISDSKDFNSDI